jgi:hypothetical protein
MYLIVMWFLLVRRRVIADYDIIIFMTVFTSIIVLVIWHFWTTGIKIQHDPIKEMIYR